MHCRAFTRPLPRVRDPLREKKREKENSPTSQSFRTSSAVSVCVTPPLPSTLRWMQPTSSLGVLPTSSSGLLPSSPPTILHTLAILKTYIHLLPPSPLMLRLGLSVLRCFPPFASSSHLRTSLFRRSALASLRPHFTHRKFPSRSRNHASAPLP